MKRRCTSTLVIVSLLGFTGGCDTFGMMLASNSLTSLASSTTGVVASVLTNALREHLGLPIEEEAMESDEG